MARRILALRSSRQITSALVFVATFTIGGVVVNVSGASSVTKPTISISFANGASEVKSMDRVKVCASSLPIGARAYLEEQEGTNHVWRPVWAVGKLRNDHCAEHNVPTLLQGRFVFKARVWLSKKMPLDSRKKIVTVYGPVDFKTLCSNVSGCRLINGGGGPIQVNGNIDEYVDWLCGNNLGDGFCSSANRTPQSYTLNANNSCRSLTFDSVLLASDNGLTGGTVSIEVVQHTLNQQFITPVLNAVTSSTVNLDGGPIVVNLTNTGPLSLYFLSETADCYTLTGTLSTNAG